MKQKITSSQISIHIGQQIKKARLAKKISQAQLGDMLELTYQQIQKYENGTSMISAAKIYFLAQILDAPLLQFFPGKSSSLIEEASPKYTAPENLQEQQLIDDYRGIENPQVRASFRMIGSVLSKNPTSAKKRKRKPTDKA